VRIFLFAFIALLNIPNAPCATEIRTETDPVIQSGQQVVVKLFGAGVGTLDSYGSGVLISESGHVITVWNHLVNNSYLNAVVFDGRRFSVKVLGTSLQHDLALLKIECEDNETFPFADWKKPATVSAGESVMAFSNVYHVATGNEPVSVIHGVVACETPLQAGFGRWEFPVKDPVYILDAVTNNSGAAGGLLTNGNGAAVGLLGREIRHRESDMWVNYAVPWKVLQPAIGELLNGRRIAAATTAMDDRKMVSGSQLTAEFGLTLLPAILEKTPAYVDRVIPGSPAGKAGFVRGDLILMVDNQVVQSVDDLRAALATYRKGQAVSFTISRDESLQGLSLRVP
jgi:serine protease Do